MNSKILKKENNIVTVEFTIPREDFEKATDKAYLKLRNRINIQGFRKGKAPKHLIEKKYGKDVFYEDALDIALSEVYPKVVEENKLDVINSPKIDFPKIEDGSDIVLTAEVEVMPEVTLCEYKGIEVEKAEIKVTDEDVEKELAKLQDQNARIIEVTDRAVKDGDTLTIDYKGFVGDNQFEGGTAENQTLVIGSKSFIPGFEEQLIGKNANEEIEINVTFPEEYHAEDLKGKDATFKVLIHEIKEKELPALDDDFAKDISEFDTIEELKADTRKKLEEKAKQDEAVANDNNVITKVVDASEVIVPEVMVQKEIEYQAKNYEQQFRMQGFTGKEFEDIIKNLVEQYKQNYRTQAEFNVKADLVFKALIEKENIEVSEEEMNAEYKKLAESYKIEDDKFESFKQSISASSGEYIKESIQKRKAVDMLIAEAKFVSKEA